MKLKYIPIFIIFLSIYGLLNYYIGITVYEYIINYFSVKQIWFWIIFLFISLSYPISMSLNRFFPNPFTNILQLIGSYWMVFFLYSLILFPIISILNALLSKFYFYTTIGKSIMLVETLLVIMFFIVTSVLGYYNANKSYVNSVELSALNVSLKNTLNIVMVSDIHLGTIIRNKHLSKMIDEINELHPDIVLIAGDIIDSDIKPFLINNMAKEFSNINSKYGTFATLGNHDLMTNSTDEIVSELEKNNVKVLRDEAVLIDNSFYIIGRDDVSINRFGSKRKSLNDIVSNLDNDIPKIVIDHTPTSLDESLTVNANLHFSGHTHSGQLAPANLITKIMFEIDHGYLNKDNLHVIVSSGYGTWGPPLRIGSKREIVNVKIQ